VICGWIVTETGRQPWVGHGVLRTADAVSPVAAASVTTTLVLFVLVYGVVGSLGLYYINRLIMRGPGGPAIEPPRAETSPWPSATGRGAFVEPA
jgi:cytochrome d ubiquinol oxidase subunit I